MKLHEVIILVIPVAVLNLSISVIPAYYLWNWIVPEFFSLPKISFLQMLGLIVLIKCFITKGFISVNAD
jgi:hypothetical protein